MINVWTGEGERAVGLEYVYVTPTPPLTMLSCPPPPYGTVVVYASMQMSLIVHTCIC